MTANVEPEIAIRFEGFGTGTEIIGGTQANFLIAQPGAHAKEVAVIVNEPALEFLAGMLGRADGESFRQDATRHVGERWLTRLTREGRPIDPVIFLSRSRMEMVPGFLDEVRQAFEKQHPPVSESPGH